jgi:hypothetical protein
LCNAVREYTEARPQPIWQRLAVAGRQTREALADLPGWAVLPEAGTGSAITALRAVNGQDVRQTRTRLLDEHGIVTTACATTRAPRDMTAPLLCSGSARTSTAPPTIWTSCAKPSSPWPDPRPSSPAYQAADCGISAEIRCYEEVRCTKTTPEIPHSTELPS